MKDNPNNVVASDSSRVESGIWQALNILRSENVSSEDYYVILYLLSLENDNLLSVIDSRTNAADRINIDSIDNTKESIFNAKYGSIHGCFKPVLDSISYPGFTILKNLLHNIVNCSSNDNFSSLFDRILYELSQSQGRYGGELIQPSELTRFMLSLSEVKNDYNIFNPFAGLASFGVHLKNNQNYYGQEINRKTWALGLLRLMAYDRLPQSDFVAADSVMNWPDASKKFDLIISNPPIGMRLGEQYRQVISDFKTLELFYLEKGIEILSNNGKLIAVLPQRFLHSGFEEERVRKMLVDQDLLETVISLPGGLLLNTGFSLSIIVISKKKPAKGKVKMVDGKNFTTNNGPRERILNDTALLEIINSSDPDNSIVKTVSNEEIEANNYNLSVARYSLKKVEGIKLREILSLIPNQRGNLPTHGKFIRIRDLKGDKVDYSLDTSVLENSELGRVNTQVIAESCLLIALRWKTLKPTFFEFQGEPIFKNPDILSLKVDESIADIAYLINELHADYVIEQLDSLRLGSSIPFLRREDFLDVVIKLPPINEQRAKIQGILELTQKINILEKERDAILLGHTIEQFNEFASLKHTLGRPRQNILDWTDNILDFFNQKKEAFKELNSAFAQFYEKDILSALQEIKRDINFMTDVLEKGESGFILDKHEKQVFSLEVVNALINELSNNGFNFKISKILLPGDELEEKGIEINLTLFKTLLDNILTNANKYAFDDKEAGNEVVIELTEVDEYLSMEIRNNGKPFPANFDREKFITKYSTADISSGSGLGGYDIHRIACDFNNPDWILSLNEDPLYPVKFKFQFPIKPIS